MLVLSPQLVIYTLDYILIYLCNYAIVDYILIYLLIYLPLITSYSMSVDDKRSPFLIFTFRTKYLIMDNFPISYKHDALT